MIKSLELVFSDRYTKCIKHKSHFGSKHNRMFSDVYVEKVCWSYRVIKLWLDLILKLSL